MKKKTQKLFCIPSDKSKGFTLIEMVFSIAICMVLIVVIGSLLENSVRYGDKYKDRFSRQSDINFVLDGVVDEIQSADTVLLVSPNLLEIKINQVKGEEFYREEGDTKNLKEKYTKSIKYMVYNYNFRRRASNNSYNWGENTLLQRVKKFHARKEGNLLILLWEIDGNEIIRYVNIRGEKI